MPVEIPKHPTHAVKHVDNWDGEHSVVYTLAFKADEYYDWDSGKPLLEYEGDEILGVWELR